MRWQPVMSLAPGPLAAASASPRCKSQTEKCRAPSYTAKRISCLRKRVGRSRKWAGLRPVRSRRLAAVGRRASSSSRCPLQPNIHSPFSSAQQTMSKVVVTRSLSPEANQTIASCLGPSTQVRPLPGPSVHDPKEADKMEGLCRSLPGLMTLLATELGCWIT